MFAVVKAGGHQYKVQKGDEIIVDKINGNVGDKVDLDKVLMLGGENPTFGAPFVSGAKVEAVIKNQGRAPKIIVFKYKRTKNYKVNRGHKQPQTTIEIKNISK